MINTTSERLKAGNFFICRYFSLYERFKFHAQLSWLWKKFYNLEAMLETMHEDSYSCIKACIEMFLLSASHTYITVER